MTTGKNNVNTVQSALAACADKNQPAALEDIVVSVESNIMLGINRQWAAEALRSSGFQISGEAPDQVVSKSEPSQPDVLES